jgi:hypothetical protein
MVSMFPMGVRAQVIEVAKWMPKMNGIGIGIGIGEEWNFLGEGLHNFSWIFKGIDICCNLIFQLFVVK